MTKRSVLGRTSYGLLSVETPERIPCSSLWNDAGTSFSEAVRIRLNLEEVTGVRLEKGRQ